MKDWRLSGFMRTPHVHVSIDYIIDPKERKNGYDFLSNSKLVIVDTTDVLTS